MGLVLGVTLGQGQTNTWAIEELKKSAKELQAEAEAARRPVTQVVVEVPDRIEPTHGLAPTVVLYDQNNSINENATSQNFEAVYDDYDNEAADDFVVTAGGGWLVTSVFAPGVYSVTHGIPTSMRVTFYADAGGQPGATICNFAALPFVEAPSGSFTINLPGGCVLGAGTKWVAVVANLNFLGGGGQWFWSSRTVQSGNPSKWRNPGGGFGTPCADWGTRTACLLQVDPDQAFTISGDLASCSSNADCQDGNLCNGVETCVSNSCVPGTPVNCDDGLFCTTDICAPATGACSHGVNLCEDGDSCTADSCVEGSGCSHVTPAPIHLCNTGSVTIPNSGAGTPYPSTIVAGGLPPQASLCSVELNGITHTFPDDIDILLVGPAGGASNTFLMSDAGGSGAVTNVNLVLKDSAATAVPDASLPSGTFKPVNYGTGDTFPAPSPAPAGGAALSIFNGQNPNGNWNLFVVDDAGGDLGSISGGWCLNIVISSCTIDAQCSDGNACNGLETCVSGTCQNGTPVNCDDGLFCTNDSCNPSDGSCVYVANPCNDSNGCTVDTCNEIDGCVNTDACVQFCNINGLVINDSTTPPAPATPYPTTIAVAGVGTPATVASVEFGGLSHTFPDDIDMLLVGPAGQNATIFSDAGGGTDIVGAHIILSDAAATQLSDTGPLVDGTFRPANFVSGDVYAAPAPAPSANVALSTFDGDPNGNWSLFIVDDANVDSGSMTSWCVNLLPPASGCGSDAECNDDDACTTDTCNGGVCDYAVVNADDGNPCTDDSCDPSTGVHNDPNTDPCSDGNACTSGDVCGGGSCNPGGVVDPDDGNPCTDDSCDPGTGVHNDPNNAPCSDGNACTAGDTCGGGSCQSGAPVVCNDGNVCTDEVCNPGTGLCDTTNNTNTCDDGDPGTIDDVCSGGSCSGTPVCENPEPNPRTNGYYKRLCHGPHSGDELTADDAACVASLGTRFASVASVADICAVLEPSQPNGSQCAHTDTDLMSLALNVCKQKVCASQSIDSQCGGNGTVGESYGEADGILSDPDRTNTSCMDAKCLTEEINTGRALELNTLALTRISGGLRLDWSIPTMNDGTQIPKRYKVYRRVVGSLAPFTLIASPTLNQYVDNSGQTGTNYQYEVVPVF